MAGSPLIAIITVAFSLYRWILIIKVLTSWLPPQSLRHPIFRFIDRITDPILDPFRRIIPSMGGADFSPVLVFFLLQLLQNIVINALYRSGM